jgi:predicted ATPase
MSRGDSWFVLTGAPSAGKTSTLARIQQAGHLTIPEASRAHIDEMLASGMSLGDIRSDPAAHEQAILKRMLAVEAGLATNRITFFDRALHDVWAYYAVHGLSCDDLAEHGYRPDAAYARAFLLEFRELRPDYARTESAALARRLEDLLEEAYLRAGVPVSRLPWVPIQRRVGTILEAVSRLAKTEHHA